MHDLRRGKRYFDHNCLRTKRTEGVGPPKCQMGPYKHKRTGKTLKYNERHPLVSYQVPK